MTVFKISSEALDQFRNGDQKVFKEIHDHFFDLLTSFANKTIDDPDVAKEIANIQLMKLWNKREHFDTAGNIKAFLFIATKNACLDYIKRRNRENEKNAGYAYVTPAIEDHQQQLEFYITHLVVHERFYRAIENLPQKQRMVIKLHLEKHSTEEISKIMRIKPKTVLNLKLLAVQKIKAELLLAVLMLWLA